MCRSVATAPLLTLRPRAPCLWLLHLGEGPWHLGWRPGLPPPPPTPQTVVHRAMRTAPRPRSAQEARWPVPSRCHLLAPGCSVLTAQSQQTLWWVRGQTPLSWLPVCLLLTAWLGSGVQEGTVPQETCPRKRVPGVRLCAEEHFVSPHGLLVRTRV